NAATDFARSAAASVSAAGRGNAVSRQTTLRATAPCIGAFRLHDSTRLPQLLQIVARRLELYRRRFEVSNALFARRWIVDKHPAQHEVRLHKSRIQAQRRARRDLGVRV